MIAEIASQYPTLVFVESHAKEFNAWGASVYIDGEKFYKDENWGPSCDDVLEGLVRKLVDAKEADKEAGNGWDSEMLRVVNRWQVVVNRSEADAKAAADLAVNGLICLLRRAPELPTEPRGRRNLAVLAPLSVSRKTHLMLTTTKEE